MRYRPPDSHQLVPGVSINIKGLLSACDQCGVNHPSEKILRRCLRQTRLAITAGHQRFLPDNFPCTGDVATIPRSCFTKERACVTVPREVLPEEFFELLNDSMLSTALYNCDCGWPNYYFLFAQLEWMMKMKLQRHTRRRRRSTRNIRRRGRRDRTLAQKVCSTLIIHNMKS